MQLFGTNSRIIDYSVSCSNHNSSVPSSQSSSRHIQIKKKKGRKKNPFELSTKGYIKPSAKLLLIPQAAALSLGGKNLALIKSMTNLLLTSGNVNFH